MPKTRTWLALLAVEAVALGCSSSTPSGSEADASADSPIFAASQCDDRPRPAADPAVCTPQLTGVGCNSPFDQRQPKTICGESFTYACGLPAGTGPFAPDAGPSDDAGDGAVADAEPGAIEDAGPPAYDCATLCKDATHKTCTVSHADSGPSVTVLCAALACGAGRRPEGFVAGASRATTVMGRALAAMAELEAASIPAFARLRDELAALGASDVLLARVETARKDEVRHARVVTKLARRHGASDVTKRVRVTATHPRGARGAREVAIENMIEGCIRETYGALVLHAQARRAPSPEVRAAFEAIAVDELSHAELSWDVADFLTTRLDTNAHRDVEDAQARAIDELRADIALRDEALAEALGAPSRGACLAILARLEASLARPIAA